MSDKISDEEANKILSMVHAAEEGEELSEDDLINLFPPLSDEAIKAIRDKKLQYFKRINKEASSKNKAGNNPNRGVKKFLSARAINIGEQKDEYFYWSDVPKRLSVTWDKLIESFYPIADNFTVDIAKFSEDLDATAKLNFDFDNCADQISNYNFAYKKYFKIGNENIVIKADTNIVHNILMGRDNNDTVDYISKSVANDYVFKPLVNCINEVSAKPLVEKNKLSIYKPCKLCIKVTSQNTTGHIILGFTNEAIFEFLNEEKPINFNKDENYYKKNNIYAPFGRIFMGEYEINNLSEGDLISLKCNFTKVDIVFCDHVIAKAEPVILNNNIYGIRIIDENAEEDSIDKEGDNTYVVLGTTYKTAKEILGIGEGDMETLDSSIYDYYPLVFNNMVVAVVELVYAEKDIGTFKVIEKLEKPIPFVGL